jgi:preprotein translocase subunit SecA
MDGILTRLGLKEGEAIIHPWINKALEKAQQKVEARNFEIRKNLLKYDDVMNDQRKVIYEQRKELMGGRDVSQTVKDMRDNVIEKIVTTSMPEKAYAEQWDTHTLHEEILRIFGLDLPIADWAKEEGVADSEINERIVTRVTRKMADKAATWGPEVMRDVEKSLLLQVLDQVWKEHLLALDHLRHGIGLRAYGQKDPLNEYKGEAFEMFNGMLGELDERVTLLLAHIELKSSFDQNTLQFGRSENIQETNQDPAFANESPQRDPRSSYGDAVPMDRGDRAGADVMDAQNPDTWIRTGRNQPCPCGSGRKYKHCHGINR